MIKYYYNIIERALSSSINLHKIASLLIAVTYVGLLLLFSHIDFIIDSLEHHRAMPSENFDFFLYLTKKHAHFVSFITNFGLLAMLLFDMALMSKDGYTLWMATVMNVGSIIPIIFVFWSSMSLHTDISHIPNEMVCFKISFLLFIICLLYVKYKTLPISEI